jgi:predicted dehydrogenase
VAQAMEVAVVGLGKIGQYLDAELDSSRYCLTHSSAVAQHSAFVLSGGVDPSEQSRRDFSHRFSAPAFSSLSEAASRARFDGLILCGPTSSNAAIVRQAVDLKPRWILMEKPMGQSLREAEEITRLCQDSKIFLGVNFIRRSEPGVLKVRDLLATGRIGGIQKVIVTYSKGLFNNASHFVDLLRFWLGEGSHHQVMGSISQSHEGDPEPDFGMHFGGVPSYFVSAKEDQYSVRDLEIIGSRGVIKYLRGGLKIQVLDIAESKVFKGYKFAELDGTEIPNQLNRAQFFVMDSIAKSIQEGKSLSFSGAEALKTMEHLERIKSLCHMH